MEFSQRDSQSSQATTIVMSNPPDVPCSPSVERPDGTVYFSSYSSSFQRFSAFQKQNFPLSFQDPYFQQSFQDPHFHSNEINIQEQIFSTGFLGPHLQQTSPRY